MKFTQTFILSLAPFIPAVIGLFKLKSIDKKFHPFIYAMVLAIVVEVLFRIAVDYKWPLAMRFGVYNFSKPLTLFLYLLFFKRNGVINSTVMWTVLVFFITIIAGTIIYRGTIAESLRFPAFILYGIICVLAVNLLSTHITSTLNSAERNFYLVMCSAAIVMCVFFIFIGSYSYLATKDFFFRKKLFSIQPFINAACYLSFAWAILCIPKIKR
jgi:hypothetical protein